MPFHSPSHDEPRGFDVGDKLTSELGLLIATKGKCNILLLN